MTRIPIVNFKTMEKVLLRLGFEPLRRKGSHVFYRHSNGRTTTLPHHPGRDLARPLIREILREIEQRLFGSRFVYPLAAVLFITHRYNLSRFYCTQRAPQNAIRERLCQTLLCRAGVRQI